MIQTRPFRRLVPCSGRSGLLAALAVGLFAWSIAEAESRPADPVALLWSAAPASNTLSIAGHQGYRFSGLHWGEAAAKPEPGDRVTALVSLYDKNRPPTQWIIRLSRAAREAAAAPAPEASLNFHTNAGDDFIFRSEVTAMELESLGPIGPAADPGIRLRPRRSRILVSSDFLTLDLNRAALVVIKMQEQSKKLGPAYKFELSGNTRPFPPGGFEAVRRNLAPLGLTPDDRRSFAGSVPALMQFLQVVLNTPDLQNILLGVIDKPSIFDVVRHGLPHDVGFNFIQAGRSSHGHDIFGKDTGDRPLSALVFNLDLYQKPVLTTILYVTPPRPPLEVSAGIVGIVAMSPTRAGQILVVKMLASQPGQP